MRASHSLCFRPDGTFRILLATDLHAIVPEMDENPEIVRPKCDALLRLLEAGMDTVQPDLVVFNGDNVAGHWKTITQERAERIIRIIMRPAAERGLPLALVFGNHDAEQGVSREHQLRIYQEFDNCLANAGEPNLPGCGNYCLTILDRERKKAAFGLWFLDSGDYAPEGGFARVQNSQIDWYERESNRLCQENGGAPLPSLLFQHIPIPEVYGLFKQVPSNTPGAVTGHGDWSDRFFVIADPIHTRGALGEGPGSPERGGGQFASWIRQRDIVGAFFGHDHLNDFDGEVGGIRLIQTHCAGFTTYGAERGLRVITLDEEQLPAFETHMLDYSQLLGREAIPAG